MTLALSLFFPLRVAVKPTPSNPLCPATRYKLGVNKKNNTRGKEGNIYIIIINNTNPSVKCNEKRSQTLVCLCNG